MMREELQEALKEARQLKDAAIEEEILTGVTNIEKTCSNALRHFGKAESLLRNTSARARAGR
jgi:hypothetical protein